MHWCAETELDSFYLDSLAISSEFFVAVGTGDTEAEVWNTKYTLRADMLPSFIAKELAHKILLIGKTINFTRECCHDREPMLDHVVVSKMIGELKGKCEAPLCPAA